jgi:hypothetical protein
MKVKAEDQVEERSGRFGLVAMVSRTMDSVEVDGVDGGEGWS